MAMVFIYALADPTHPCTVRYIGKTKKPLSQRLSQHIYEAQKLRCHRSSWLKSLLRENRKPIIWEVERCDEGQWEDRERALIALFRRCHPLVNCTDGGDTGPDMTGFRFTEEMKSQVRAGLAKAKDKLKWSPERRVKMLAILRQHRPTPEQVKKTAETKRRLASEGDRSWERGILAAIKANTGNRYSPERVAKTTAARKLAGYCTTNPTAMKKVLCVETGQLFESHKSAADIVKRDRRGIRQAIILGTRCGGFHWTNAGGAM